MKYFLSGMIILLSVYVLHTSAELTEFLRSDDEVNGVYKNENGSLGIKFNSRQGYLLIETLSNITLVYFNSFREVDKRMARSVYMLDGEYLQHRDSAHGHLDRPVGNTTRSFNDTLKDLLQLEETTLLEDASRAVGEQGVIGKDTPAVLPFYMFALKVTQLLDPSMQNSIRSKANEQSPIPPRQKRFFSWVKKLKGCLKYLRYSNCRGLCGPRCLCVKWICGDCCYHKGCYDHDECCRKYGYRDTRCLLPIDFRCDRYHC